MLLKRPQGCHGFQKIKEKEKLNELVFISVHCTVSHIKAVLSVRKQLMWQLPEGRFGLIKYNNIGTFERICL